MIIDENYVCSECGKGLAAHPFLLVIFRQGGELPDILQLPPIKKEAEETRVHTADPTKPIARGLPGRVPRKKLAGKAG